MDLHEEFEQRLLLGVPAMDQTHREFVTLLGGLAGLDGVAFRDGFGELLRHTVEHFQQEQRQMAASGFPARHEHQGEHERVLGELMHLRAGLEQGRSTLARAYVRERLPAWFRDHARSMDSALAAHLRARSGAAPTFRLTPP
jgi:hemerythrin